MICAFNANARADELPHRARNVTLNDGLTVRQRAAVAGGWPSADLPRESASDCRDFQTIGLASRGAASRRRTARMGRATRRWATAWPFPAWRGSASALPRSIKAKCATSPYAVGSKRPRSHGSRWAGSLRPLPRWRSFRARYWRITGRKCQTWGI